MTEFPVAREVAASALDLVVPQDCAGCGQRGRSWCHACALQVRGTPAWVPGPVPCRAAATHHGPAGRAVVAFKDAGVRSLVGPLSGMLTSAVLAVLVDLGGDRRAPVWLVPVPSRRSARRRRGSEPVGDLAARAARALRGLGLSAHRVRALAPEREVADQVGLSRAQRRVNVASSLVARPLPSGLVVIVDDVVTTGATLAEAVRALSESSPSRREGATGAAAVTWSPGAGAARRDGGATSVVADSDIPPSVPFGIANPSEVPWTSS